jgi:uncharacterized membrane protein
VKISEKTNVNMPLKTIVSLIIMASAFTFSYFEITSKIQQLETAKSLMSVDVEENSKFRIETAKTLLEEKIRQVPIDKEQFFILEEILKSIERIEKEQESSRFNYVNIENLKKNMDKVLNDIENLKDKTRENGKSTQ